MQDNERDRRTWRTATANAMYQKTFARSSSLLEGIGANVSRLQQTLQEQYVLEVSSESEIRLAAVPTGCAYAAVVHDIQRFGDNGCELSFDQRETLGLALGGAIYAIDAVRDYEADIGIAYNPLCIQGGNSNSMPTDVRRNALMFIEERLASAGSIIKPLGEATHKRWNAVAAHLLSHLRPFPEFVTLSARCYVPCDHGVVAFDDKECTPAAYACLCCCCVGFKYCT